MRTGTPEPGSAREEAERLVATALAMAQTAVAGARYRAGARDLVGTVGQAIADVLDQVVPTQPASPAGRPSPDPAGPPTPDSGQRPATPAGEAPQWTGESSEPAAEQAREMPGAGDDQTSRHGFATGGPECCVCPVCRVISGLRDPSPELVERLATGAGDLAARVASLLRAFSAVANSTGAGSDSGTSTSTGSGSGSGAGTGSADRATTDAQDRAPGSEPDSSTPSPRVVSDVPGGPGERHADAVWREATRTGHDSGPAVESDVWAAATRAAGTPLATGEFFDPGDRSTASGTGPTASGTGPTASGTGPVDRAGPSGTAGKRPSVPASRTPEGSVDTRATEPGTPDSGA